MNKIIYSLLAGIAIGLLVAPAKGSETIKRISDRFRDITDNLSDQADETINKGKKAFKEGKQQLSEMGKTESQF